MLLVSVPSPDSRLMAVVFERDCGATTGASTQVSVIPFGAALPNKAGNVFIADTDHGAAPSGPGGGPAVGARWLSPSEAVVSHHRAARVFLAERSFESVMVSYEQFASKPGA
jgi:hypothetical protein